jgi:hypothetical protein
VPGTAIGVPSAAQPHGCAAALRCSTRDQGAADYGEAFPRLAGMLLLGLAALGGQIIRHRYLNERRTV